MQKSFALSLSLILITVMVGAYRLTLADSAFTIRANPEGVLIGWKGTPATDTLKRPWQALERAGTRFPVQTFTLWLPPTSDPTPRIGELVAAPLKDDLTTSDGERRFTETQLSQPVAESDFPDAPLIVLRESMLRGQRMVVYALSPVFSVDGELLLASRMRASIPQARLSAPLAQENPVVVAQSGPSQIALQPAIAFSVEQAGMYAISGAALAELGLPADGYEQLRLWRDGVEVPMEVLRDTGGKLAGFRFYAPPPGDRFNAADPYRLTFESATTPLRITTRQVEPDCLLGDAVARQRGVWEPARNYKSRRPGFDGDHFFAATLTVAPAGAASTDAVFAPTLPLAIGAARLQVEGSSNLERLHTITVAMAGVPLPIVASGTAPWAQNVLLPIASVTATVRLQGLAGPDNLLLERIRYDLPVRLEFAGKGANFSGGELASCFRLNDLPTTTAIYDTTDPGASQRLLGWEATLNDRLANRDYLVVDEASLPQPALRLREAIDLTVAAEALYVVPNELRATLEPLLVHRRNQGYSVAAITTETIYEAFGNGRINPAAIRDFLRFAVATGQPVPTTVAFVGDGTSDPRNYLGRNNATLVPPYLANVDPFVGETSCDACYVRLDGESPADDLVADLHYGRLPVKSKAELQSLIAKLIAYDATSSDAEWRNRSVYIADNPDSGGDFIASSEASAAREPATQRIGKVYFDPNAALDGPERLSDPLLARQRTIAAFDAGALFLNYTGHGIQFQWAFTGPPLQSGQPTDKQHLLGLYDPNGMRNGTQLPIVLAMTCLTSAFQQPAFSGTTIDERLVLAPNGGAVAVWGGSGLSLASGHDLMRDAFYDRFWREPDGIVPLGELATEGYRAIFEASCCTDLLSTYILLGDPLTPVRAPGSQQLPTPTPVVPPEARLNLPLLLR